MSSTYKVLCLSHDPATVYSGYRTPEGAVEAILAGPEEHPRCDLVISEVSGAPVRFGCPPAADLRAGQHVCWGHQRVEWVDADWLRLLAHAYEGPGGDAVVRSLLHGPMKRCWSRERLVRLRYELGIEVGR